MKTRLTTVTDRIGKRLVLFSKAEGVETLSSASITEAPRLVTDGF